MPSLRSLIDPAGRSLAYHVTRLKAKLDDLRERLHEAAARMLGETVAKVVEQVVHQLLSMPCSDRSPAYRPDEYHRPERRSWADDDSPDYLYDPHEAHPAYRRDERDEDEFPESQAEPPHASRWQHALLVGLRAATWWLQRWTGRWSLCAALGLGVTAAGVTLTGGPLTVAAAGVVSSALGFAGMIAMVNAGMPLPGIG